MIKLKICSGCDRNKQIWKNLKNRIKLCKECYGKSLTGVAKKPKSTAKRIPTFSSKMQKKKALYNVMRIKFLDDHPMCKFHHPGICTQKATEVHHKHSGKDRQEYYLDVTTWLSICRSCHNWLHTHEKEAKELDFLL